MEHTRAMATGTRFLPTGSPTPYFQQLEWDLVTEGAPSDLDLPVNTLHGMHNVRVPPRHANSDIFPYLPSSSFDFDSRIADQDKLSTYTGLDDYDTLFEARHGREAIDKVSISSTGMLPTSPVAVPLSTMSIGVNNNVMVGARPKYTPDSKCQTPSKRSPDSVERENWSPTEHTDVPPMGTEHILGEGDVTFTDMMETVLAALDQQMAKSGEAQKSEGSLVDKLSASRQISSNGDIQLKESEPGQCLLLM